MERSTRHVSNGAHGEFLESYDLEQELELAERRYAEARAAFEKARAEERALSAQRMVNPQLLEDSRTRLKAVAARCGRLRALIESLEEKLDV